MKIVITICMFFVLMLCNAQSKYPSILWEIKKANTDKPSYLFGTYHISNKGVFKLGDSLFYALQNVDIVAKEVNANTWQDEQDKMDKMEVGYYSYKNQVRNLTFTENTLKKTNTIEKLPAFLALTPNFINYFLYRNNPANEGFEEEMYLDRFISSTGYKYGKEVKGLENYLESNVLGIEGEKDQNDLEKKEVKKIPGDLSYREMYDKIYDGYLNNNLNAMDSFLIYQYESEAYYNKFIAQRNYNQADSIDYYINTGKTIFAAVGCAHLPGSEGVIEILRKKGYALRPVQLIYKNNEKLDALKKMIVPMQVSSQTIDDVITVKAPGKFYPYNKSDILKTYGHVDMKNGAYYLIARLYNNAAYFNYDENKIKQAIDSLLYSSIKGNITSKKITEYKGYNCIDVNAIVKNKDVERYRLLITPYEIIKFQVGGKNNYALSSFVDSFFNSIDIMPEQVLSNSLSFNFKNNTSFHQWKNTSSGYIQNKQRYSYYDTKNKQLNQCIKNIVPIGTKINDSIITHLIRESILLSDAYPKSYIEDNTLLSLPNGKINTLLTKTGKEVLIKYIIQFPVVYILSSISNSKADSTFIQSFQLKDYKLNSSYSFTDSARGFSVSIPYQLQPASLWKYQLDRKRKQFDDDKDPNSTRNLYYYPSMYGNNQINEQLLFEDIENMEAVKLEYIQFDSLSYYPNATAFWKKILERYEPSKPSTNYEYNSETIVSTSFSSRGATKEITRKITNLQYDTSSINLQKISFVLNDSINKKNTAYQYFLSGNKLYALYYPTMQGELTALQKQITTSFKPLNTASIITIYQPKLLQIVKEYFTATKQKQPAVLNKLNNLNLGILNLKQVDSLFQSLSTATTINNILRRKLMDMVSEGLYKDKEWKVASAWFQTIYNNKKMPATIRSFAVSSILKNKEIIDAKWLIENFVNTGNAFQKKYAYELKTYLNTIYPKKDFLNIARLLVKEKTDLDNISLIDSGYFSIADKIAAFTYFKKMLEDDALNLQVSQERNQFIFNEKELSETATGETARSNFKPLLNAFKYFYSLNPTDPFFDDTYKKIISSKSDEDILRLLDILLAQAKPDYTKINELVKLLNTGQKNMYEVNRIFYSNKKYDRLTDSLKNRQIIAKHLMLEERGRYNKLDSLIFIGAEKYQYNQTDSVYFFKYIRERETNSNIAYIILDNENKFLTATPEIAFTDEQVSALEPYGKIVKKLMRKHYTNTYFLNKNSFYLQSSSSKSLNSEE